MKTVGDSLREKSSPAVWVACVVSAGLTAAAMSVFAPGRQVSAQGAAPPPPIRGESRQVLTALENAFGNIAEQVEPAVVTIASRNLPSRDARAQPAPDAAPEAPESPESVLPEGIPAPFRDFFRFGVPGRPGSPAPPQQGTGSGVIIRRSGDTYYVLTNNHVVDGMNRFDITTNTNQEFRGEVVGLDPQTDLAVLKFKANRPLPAGSVANLGDSDKVRVGQWAVAIGSPLGYDNTLTVGVISAKGRELRGVGSNPSAAYDDLLQTDASINPGNSGGPLVNIDGQVIGINVAIATPSGMNVGIGFAIPSKTASTVAEALIEKGKVVRGYLGVSVSNANRDLSAELREHLKAPKGGALIEDVQPNSPASRAGLKPGDVIVRFGTREIAKFDDLNKAVWAVPPGTAVAAEIIREGRPMRLSITPAERPDPKELARLLNGPNDGGVPSGPGEGAGSRPTRSRFGLTLQNNPDGGVRIFAVEPGSSADDAGIQPGDVILKAGSTEVKNAGDLDQTLQKSAADQPVVLQVRAARGGGIRYVVIRPQ